MTEHGSAFAADTSGTRLEVDGIQLPDAVLSPELMHLYRHSSVRSFSARPLERGMLEAIAAAAVSASTSSNQQLFSMVAVEDEERRKRLSVLSGKQAFIAQAPLFLGFCPDIYRNQYVCARQNREYRTKFLDQFCIALGDTHLAMQNAALAAEALGLGVCMIGGVRQSPREIAELLELPKGVYCAVGMSIGYAAGRNPVKPRLPLRVVLHRERYSTEHLAEGLEEYDRAMIASGIYKGREVSTPEDPARSEPYGWCEHTSRRLSQPDAINAASGNREFIRQFLIEQGFDLD